VFVEPFAVGIVFDQFLRAAEQLSFALSAYCFMPDHVHLLIEGESTDCDGQRFVGLAKQLSGFHFKKQVGFALWQRYGYERVLRSDEQTLIVARYILENPVRAWLVRSVHDYPYLGSTKYEVGHILEAAGKCRIRSG
jgi:putative transposase